MYFAKLLLVRQVNDTMLFPLMPSLTAACPTVAFSSNLSPVTKSDGKVMVTFFDLALSINF